MTNRSVPSIIISGVSSGSGKTTVTLGLMAAFKARGLRVQPFKCGPDFIDPGLHRLATGRVSRNLDQWMTSPEFARNCFYRQLQSCDVCIIEGVMGMFDGGLSSSGALAEFLKIPTVLVLDVRSMAESAGAIVKGFESFQPGCEVRGVILNRIGSERHLQLVSASITSHCRAEILGHLPRKLDFTIPERHLGLFTGDEAPISEHGLNQLATSIEEHIDLDKLMSLCAIECEKQPPAVTKPLQCRIGVARDLAFCFYYEDNFDLLRQAGAELVYFSPVNNAHLPLNLDGLYLGGGYPELYAETLSKNQTMLSDIRNFAENGGAIFAECGGFMYLTEGIVDQDDRFHAMVGIFPVRASMQKSRASLGYREITTRQPTCFGPTGTVIRGHEFHYSRINHMPEDIPRAFSLNNNHREGYCCHRVLGGYMHLHFGSNPGIAEAFIKYCKE